MASRAVRISFHIALAVLVVLVLFYVRRPLYWKITATVHNICHNKQTVKQVRKVQRWCCGGTEADSHGQSTIKHIHLGFQIMLQRAAQMRNCIDGS
ncbi:hypothetical protein SAY86_022203 [Trapa natans]|uniref:Uncharacterized protein n=1 Tax=Trapa natans TaxID=22666 RepID=A0AAN7ME76_TRANT|nr:hypothetical protein SAY86_022203 [Trapa natans]